MLGDSVLRALSLQHTSSNTLLSQSAVCVGYIWSMSER